MEVKSNYNETITFTITDLKGNVLLTEKNFHDQPAQCAKDLDHGIYVLRIMKGDELAIQRLIKK